MQKLCRAVEARCDRVLVVLSADLNEATAIDSGDPVDSGDTNIPPVECGREYQLLVRFSGVCDKVCDEFKDRLMLRTFVVFDRIEQDPETRIFNVDIQLRVEEIVRYRANEFTVMRFAYTCKQCTTIVPEDLVGLPWVRLRAVSKDLFTQRCAPSDSAREGYVSIPNEIYLYMSGIRILFSRPAFVCYANEPYPPVQDAILDLRLGRIASGVYSEVEDALNASCSERIRYTYAFSGIFWNVLRDDRREQFTYVKEMNKGLTLRFMSSKDRVELTMGSLVFLSVYCVLFKPVRINGKRMFL